MDVSVCVIKFIILDIFIVVFFVKWYMKIFDSKSIMIIENNWICL